MQTSWFFFSLYFPYDGCIGCRSRKRRLSLTFLTTIVHSTKISCLAAGGSPLTAPPLPQKQLCRIHLCTVWEFSSAYKLALCGEELHRSASSVTSLRPTLSSRFLSVSCCVEVYAYLTPAGPLPLLTQVVKMLSYLSAISLRYVWYVTKNWSRWSMPRASCRRNKAKKESDNVIAPQSRKLLQSWWVF